MNDMIFFSSVVTAVSKYGHKNGDNSKGERAIMASERYKERQSHNSNNKEYDL